MGVAGKNLSRILHFLAIMLLLAIPFYLLLRFEPLLPPVQEAVATQLRATLLLLGFNVEQEGYFLFYGGKGLEVAAACVGWRSIVVFLALVFATPGKKNWPKSILSSAVLYGFNLLRLGTSMVVFVFHSPWFEIVHGFLWKYAMTLLVLGLWYFNWKKWFR